MKNFLLILLTILAFAASVLIFMFMTGKTAIAAEFVSSSLFGIFLMNIIIFSKNKKINSYARELEKESVVSAESSSRVKVLESKIEVLEKALENALKKNN